MRKPASAKTRITSALHVRSTHDTGDECLVQIYGRQLGRRYMLDVETTLIGRSVDADIVVESDTVSRHHARVERSSEGGFDIIDLQSTNGTYVNDDGVTRAPLLSGDLVRIGDTIFKFLAGRNIESAYYEEIYRMTIQDGLTGIHNRRYLSEFLDREFSRSRRHGRDLSLAMFDLDYFKRINDEYGHLTGDYVLHELAAVIRPRVRRHELFARAGGEEFVVVLPESDLKVAMRFGEVIRKLIEQHEFLCDEHVIRVTLSVGAASLNDEMTRVEDLLRAADEAMYRAKNAGRNTVLS